MIHQDKIRGSLIGGAIGDALGYPVEFLYSFMDIQSRYGEQGITRFDLKPHWIDKREHTGKAIVSDDTQMTMFTACGLLNAAKEGIPYTEGIKKAYLEWLTTQEPNFTLKNEPKCWIMQIPELHKRRAPGNTCITALASIAMQRHRTNNSKGCGGVMRIAPIPLYAAANGRMTIEEADRLAGDAAEITHHHPLGIIPAALMAHIIYRLVQDEHVWSGLLSGRSRFEKYTYEGMQLMRSLYAGQEKYLDQMEQLVNDAFAFSQNDTDDVTNITHLGGGWVAEETLAIALYCIHRYFPADLSPEALSASFERAIIASVNHGGDSDSTGAVTGNILGTITGYDAIPQCYKADLEHHDTILKLSGELF